jgi:tyrosyl-tRNA synthetase
MTIYDELKWRGLLEDCTDPAVAGRETSETKDDSLLNRERLTLYCGFDPTADSLHVGNLVPLLCLRRFQLFGHRPIAVAGGATGMIGDPSGKSAERTLLDRDALGHNIACQKKQLARLLDFEAEGNAALLKDNADWTAEVSFLEFLRDIGKHFTVNMMIAKESVRARMEDRDVGISYTEFSYMLLQAFDFYRLAELENCELQIGGSDQWGNITAGIDLCRKKLGKQAWGLTVPLITKADGTKFGKTETGTVWLDPNRTSVYKFYQYWIRADDRDVVRYLKYFTFLPEDEIQRLASEHESDPGRRVAHTALAKEMTDLIHGEAATTEVERASKILFGGGLDGIEESTFNEIVGEIPTKELGGDAFSDEGKPLLELLVEIGLCPSKGQARKDVQGGGIYLNNVRESEPTASVTLDRILFGKHLLIRKGKRNYVVVTIV